jgi:hypothetical protein
MEQTTHGIDALGSGRHRSDHPAPRSAPRAMGSYREQDGRTPNSKRQDHRPCRSPQNQVTAALAPNMDCGWRCEYKNVPPPGEFAPQEELHPSSQSRTSNSDSSSGRQTPYTSTSRPTSDTRCLGDLNLQQHDLAHLVEVL